VIKLSRHDDDPCAGTGGIWQSEHDFRDKHASQFTTGRFVLLPKNLVTGAAKARIVSCPTQWRVGPLWKVIIT
jgi:hypothetical protein